MTRRRPDWLLAQLPMGMLDDDFFARFVSIFQEEAGTVLDVVDSLEHHVDLSVAPPESVRYLGSWIGVNTVDPSLDDQLQRRIVRESGRILAWRGTKRGLIALLELLSGDDVEVEESGGIFRQDEAPDNPGHVTMRVRSTGWLDPADFLGIVRAELPAPAQFDLFVGDEQLWPPAELAAAAPAPPRGSMLE